MDIKTARDWNKKKLQDCIDEAGQEIYKVCRNHIAKNEIFYAPGGDNKMRKDFIKHFKDEGYQVNDINSNIIISW